MTKLPIISETAAGRALMTSWIRRVPRPVTQRQRLSRVSRSPPASSLALRNFLNEKDLVARRVDGFGGLDDSVIAYLPHADARGCACRALRVDIADTDDDGRASGRRGIDAH